jgi:type II secretory pathway pseudopilin PulG
MATHGPSGSSLTAAAPVAPAPAHSATAAATVAATAAVAAASMRAAGLGLPGYPTGTGALALAVNSASPSPNRVSRLPPPGFPTSRPIPDVTWAPTMLPVDLTLAAAAITTIQAVVAASQEHQRVVSLAWEQERAMGQALTTQLATAQRHLHGLDTLPPPVVPPPRGRSPRSPMPPDSTPTPSPQSMPRPLGFSDSQHTVPRVRRVGPVVLPLPSLACSGGPHPSALRPR